MKIADIIHINRGLLSLLARNGVGTSWVNYLEMYADYERLMREGHKKTYIMAYLSEVYNIKERQLYRIVRKLGERLME